MWGTSSNYPAVRDYSGVERLFSNTKPMRGTVDLRPLDRRSSDAKSRIRKEGDNYVIRLYNTDILTYYPNGDIHVCSGRYNSRSTRCAISAMSPINAFNSQGNMAVAARDMNLTAGIGSFMMKSGGLLFKRDGEGNLRPVDPPTAFENKVRVNKVAAKAWRKYFKQVPQLIKAYSAAFVGGEALTQHTPNWNSYNDAVLDEADATTIAMMYLSRNYSLNTHTTTYVNDPKRGITTFWKDVYRQYELNEQYQVELPYGEVA